MRQVFSSPRIENVEAVARMLEEQGIEIRVSHGRSYRGAIRGNFSYRDGNDSGPRPTVWVLRADQQPQARQLLRDAGLLQSSATRAETFLPPAAIAGGDRSPLAARGGGRFRYGLLVGIAVIVGLVFLSRRSTELPDAPAGPVATTPVAAVDAPAATPTLIAAAPDIVHRIATPPALAATLLRAELEATPADRACLAIDGADPAPAVLAGLDAAGTKVVAASACGDDAAGLALDVRDYRTDGSGVGSVETSRRRDGGEAAVQRLQVAREGREWRVLRGP